MTKLSRGRKRRNTCAQIQAMLNAESNATSVITEQVEHQKSRADAVAIVESDPNNDDHDDMVLLWPHVVIDEEFSGLLPRPSEEDRQTLVADLRQNHGCRDALVLCKNTPDVVDDTIIDGHTRHLICTEYRLPFKVIHMTFASRDETKLWIIQNQFERRNLNTYQRGKVVLKLKPMVEVQTKARQGRRNDLTNIPPILGECSAGKSSETLEILARLAGTSAETLRKIGIILGEGTADQNNRADAGESISAIYGEIRPPKPKAQPQEQKAPHTQAASEDAAPVKPRPKTAITPKPETELKAETPPMQLIAQAAPCTQVPEADSPRAWLDNLDIDKWRADIDAITAKIEMQGKIITDTGWSPSDLIGLKFDMLRDGYKQMAEACTKAADAAAGSMAMQMAVLSTLVDT